MRVRLASWRTAGEFKRARPETALACAISPAPGSDTPESDSNARVTLRRWPYEMNSPAVSRLAQLEGSEAMTKIRLVLIGGLLAAALLLMHLYDQYAMRQVTPSRPPAQMEQSPAE